MKERYLTTLEKETIKALKLKAVKEDMPANALLEIIIKKYCKGE